MIQGALGEYPAVTLRSSAFEIRMRVNADIRSQGLYDGTMRSLFNVLGALALAFAGYAFLKSTSSFHEIEGLIGVVIAVMSFGAAAVLAQLEAIHEHLKLESEIKRRKNAPEAFKAGM